MKVGFCPSCGRLVLADFRFCPYCGMETRPSPGLEEVVGDSFARLEKSLSERTLEEIQALEAQLDLLEADMNLLLETAPGHQGAEGQP